MLQDYRGPDVTADNFLSVLAGEEPAVIGSSGKVIKSGPDDRVFVFYADHGAPGMPHHIRLKSLGSLSETVPIVPVLLLALVKVDLMKGFKDSISASSSE